MSIAVKAARDFASQSPPHRLAGNRLAPIRARRLQLGRHYLEINVTASRSQCRRTTATINAADLLCQLHHGVAANSLCECQTCDCRRQSMTK